MLAMEPTKNSSPVNVGGKVGRYKLYKVYLQKFYVSVASVQSGYKVERSL